MPVQKLNVLLWGVFDHEGGLDIDHTGRRRRVAGAQRR